MLNRITSVLSFVSVFGILCFGLTLNTSSAYAELNWELAGPHFSLDEPWTVSQYNEVLLKQPICPDEAKSVDEIKTSQKKTIKNDAGKAYYLESYKNTSDSGLCVFGLRNTIGDKQQVTFYTLKDGFGMMMQFKQWGTSNRFSTDNGLDNLYAGSFNGSPAKFIVYNHISYDETNCGNPEDYAKVGKDGTLKWNDKAVSKCEKSKYKMSLKRMMFVIGDDNAFKGAMVIDTKEDKGADVEKVKKSLIGKVKNVNKLKTFKLADDIECKVETVKKKDPLIHCKNK